jgi:hypothetical protein
MDVEPPPALPADDVRTSQLDFSEGRVFDYSAAEFQYVRG